MCIKQGLFWAGLFLAAAFARGQDSSAYPELFSERYFEEYGSGAGIRIQLKMHEECSGRCISKLQRGPLNFYHYLDANGVSAKPYAALSFSGKTINAGIGRGQPHIARGIILGNTMMRYGTNPSSNYRMSNNKVSIRNYPYYKTLKYLGFTFRQAQFNLFTYDNTPVFLGCMEKSLFQCGMAIYFLPEMLAECWYGYRGESLSASVDCSFANRGMNHFTADMLVKKEKFRLHLGMVWTDSLFRECRSDASWGSALKSDSFGICGSASNTFGRWRLRAMASQIRRPLFLEERIILELRFCLNPLESVLSLCGKKNLMFEHSSLFPYSGILKENTTQILKFRLSAKIRKNLDLGFQLQEDLLDRNAGFFLTRISYRSEHNLLQIQYLFGHSEKNALYALRPSGLGRYGIYRLPETEKGCWNLMYQTNAGTLECALVISDKSVAIVMEL